MGIEVIFQQPNAFCCEKQVLEIVACKIPFACLNADENFHVGDQLVTKKLKKIAR
jgi:hypothetical protein